MLDVKYVTNGRPHLRRIVRYRGDSVAGRATATMHTASPISACKTLQDRALGPTRKRLPPPSPPPWPAVAKHAIQVFVDRLCGKPSQMSLQ